MARDAFTLSVLPSDILKNNDSDASNLIDSDTLYSEAILHHLQKTINADVNHLAYIRTQKAISSKSHDDIETMSSVTVHSTITNRQNIPNPLLHKWGLSENSSSTFTSQWMKKLRQICSRKLPWKNALDYIFYDAHPSSIRLTPTLYEARPERTIIALDLIGACSYAIAHIPVPHPKYLTYKPRDTLNTNWDDLSIAGIYRVKVVPKTNTLNIWIPTRVHNVSTFCLRNDDPVELWLHRCEIKAWMLWYDLTVLYGIESEAIDHPLKSIACQLWEDRMTAKTPIEQGTAKELLAIMHTAMGPSFSKPTLQKPNHPQSLWSLHGVPLAWVRQTWLTLWARICEIDSTASLCYANVDSMHVSIKDEYVAAVKNLSGREWGHWKIQTIAKKGLWLALGKYWLHGSNGLYFKNVGATKPWATKTRHAFSGELQLKVHNSYIWHGINHYGRLIRKDKYRIIQTLPTFQELITEDQSYALRARHIRQDRQWKKQVWYLFRKGCYNEKT